MYVCNASSILGITELKGKYGRHRLKKCKTKYAENRGYVRTIYGRSET
jgi:hypothetical protein